MTEVLIYSNRLKHLWNIAIEISFLGNIVDFRIHDFRFKKYLFCIQSWLQKLTNWNMGIECWQDDIGRKGKTICIFVRYIAPTVQCSNETKVITEGCQLQLICNWSKFSQKILPEGYSFMFSGRNWSFRSREKDLL